MLGVSYPNKLNAVTKETKQFSNPQVLSYANIYKCLSVIRLLKTSCKVRLESFCCDRHLKVNGSYLTL